MQDDTIESVANVDPILEDFKLPEVVASELGANLNNIALGKLSQLQSIGPCANCCYRPFHAFSNCRSNTRRSSSRRHTCSSGEGHHRMFILTVSYTQY